MHPVQASDAYCVAERNHQDQINRVARDQLIRDLNLKGEPRFLPKTVVAHPALTTIAALLVLMVILVTVATI